MQIDIKIQLPEPKPDDPNEPLKYRENLNEALLKYTTKLSEIINSGLKITDNFDSQIQEVTFGNADTEKTIAHTLKRIPNGYIVLNQDRAGSVYDSGDTSWTTTNIYLKCDTASAVVKLWIL